MPILSFRIVNLFGAFKVYADGYVPQDVDFMVVDQHPTMQNITLRAAKVSFWFVNSSMLGLCLLLHQTCGLQVLTPQR